MHLGIASAVVIAVLGVTTFYQGTFTERWRNFNLDPELDRMAQRMLDPPLLFGDWEGEIRPRTDETKAAFGKARVKEFVEVEYRNLRTGKHISITLVCGHRRHVARHTPDQCMISAGFKYADEPKLDDITLPGDVRARFKTSQFIKQDEQTVNQRMIWTWSQGSGDERGKWNAVSSDRWGLSHHSIWYKLYVTIPLPGVEKNEDIKEAENFLKELLPELNKVLYPPEDIQPQPPADAA
jgi:hypothetical protein